MSRSLLTPLWCAAALALCACTDSTPMPAGVEVDLVHPVDLDFVAPVLSATDLMSVSISESTDSATGLLAADLIDFYIFPQTKIMNARTDVGFFGEEPYSQADHGYNSNKGKVTTTAEVTFQGQHLGSQTAFKQDGSIFLLLFGRTQHIWASALVRTDHTCGLTVRGHSAHEASWEFFQGTAVVRWGEVGESSFGGPVSQAPCKTTGGGGSGRPSPGGTSCHYLITYDMNTGVIVHAELLFCSSASALLI